MTTDPQIELANKAWLRECTELRLKKKMAKVEVSHWQAKYILVKNENNKLRKKIQMLELCVLGLSEKL